MATVTLTTLWLNDAATPSDYQAFPYLSDLTFSPQQNLTINEYAAGRRRATRTPGSAQQAAASLPSCTPQQRAWLEAKAGSVLCVRDDRGRRFFGVYTAPQVAEHAHNGDADVTLTINEVTFDESP